MELTPEVSNIKFTSCHRTFVTFVMIHDLLYVYWFVNGVMYFVVTESKRRYRERKPKKRRKSSRKWWRP